ncbi:MAG: hypothetical protein IPO01_12010 [Chitinophagaceae bacterium]|nr:hypothetical protein [Chitinophagaceae bacterium]
MNKQIKTKLLFILGAILLVTFSVTGCNNSSEEKAKEEVKTTVAPTTTDSIVDSANVAPGNDTKPTSPAP